MRIDIVFFKDSHAIANTFPIRVLFWSTIILLLCTGPVSSVNVTLSNGSIATQGESTVLFLTLDEAPYGLAGYFVNLTVDDPRVARITGIEFPALGRDYIRHMGWLKAKMSRLLPLMCLKKFNTDQQIFPLQRSQFRDSSTGQRKYISTTK